MAVVDIIEFLLMALEVTGKFKGKNFHLQKKDESFTWRSSYSWSYVYFLQCTPEAQALYLEAQPYMLQLLQHISCVLIWVLATCLNFLRLSKVFIYSSS